MSSTQDDQLLGTTLPGGYVILELVGVGGMGRVYRAEQKALGRTVAVKIIHPHLLGDESASVRFITEARAASRLNHPNSVGVIDFGKDGGQLYLVMEFLRGHDLARVVYEEGLLPFRRIIDVMCQVLAALAEAHHLDIIHRDLKPENIVLEPMRSGGDFVKVVDFGLAKLKIEGGGTGITSPGIVCGTPDYMAPEQGRGDPIDARSDLYACGVILFQLLTGRLPFEAESPTQVVLMHLSVPIPDPNEIAPDREIPDALIEVTRKALAKKADERYQSADDFSIALRSTLATFDAPSGRHSFEPPSGRFSWPEAGITCKTCKSVVPLGQKFCGDCGARISQPAPPSIRTSSRTSNAPTSQRPRISSLPTLPLPFTGREDDLDWLEACRFEVSGPTGSVSAARIVGEHGVGKTRLLNEFLRIAAADGDIIVEAGPDPWWAEVGYFALREAITGLAQLPRNGGEPSDWGSPTPEARRGLMEIFEKGNDRRNSTAPAWSTNHGPGLSPANRRFIAAEALRWAMTRARDSAGDKRVILVLDDLHAIDGASRNAFADVIAEPPLVPMLLLAAHAPTFTPEWEGSVLELGGMPMNVATSLAKGTPPTPSGEAKTARVPALYVDQLVRFTLEGGSEPPARLGDLITTRVEHLPPDARRALQAIAILGDRIEPTWLTKLVPDMSGVDEVIGTLTAAGLVEEDGPLVSTSHPLIRDVTLATTPAGVRRELHAKAMADDDEDEHRIVVPVEVQALHAYHCQDSFQALMLLETVANRAAQRGDNPGSVLALRRGLDLARREMFRGEIDDPMRAVIIFGRKLGDALAQAGDLTDAEGALREALDLAGPHGADRAYVLGSLAFVAYGRERTGEANGYLREAIEVAKLSSRPDIVTSLERMRTEWTQSAP